MRLSQIWVDPKFKKKLKKEAVEKDLSLAEFSRVLASKQDPLCEFFDKKKNGKKKEIFKL